MAPELNKVETTISIAGKECHFIYLRLDQRFNWHHQFEMHIDFEELETQWMDNPVQIINLMGEPVTITMKHKDGGGTNSFAGIITHVNMSGYHGQQNSLIISGCSPTIKLDGKDTMDSFMDKPLKMIVDEAVKNSGNGGSVTSNPKFGGKIDYICQYNESCFELLNRLSWLYGEWFFYDGVDTFFGKPGSIPTETVTYDKEITQFGLMANLLPPKFNRYTFLVHDADEKKDEDAPDKVPGIRGYIQAALNKSQSIYTSDAYLPLESLVSSKDELKEMVKAEKTRAVANMLVFQGSSQTCKVKIGTILDIKLPSNMKVANKDVEKFLITEVTHTVDQEGHYSNHFKGIPSDMENVPMSPVRAPAANPQIATVKSNADSKGRVKVEFQWQKKVGKTTNWIRVQTPDAGKSGKVATNRGYVAIPEEDDLVMVGFEYGDPNRPFVMGSIFSEQTSTGGGDGNKSKSITTRSGAKITVDDNNGKGSVTISDPSGNTIVLNGDSTMSIIAPDKITITSKEIIINGSDLVNVKSDKMIKEESQQDIESTATQNVKIQGANKVKVNSGGVIEEKAPKISISGEAQVDMEGTLVNITGKTITNVKGTPLNLN